MTPEALDHPKRPPRYDDHGSGDEYPSEEDLSDHDLHVLKTDYALQRDFTYHAAQQHPYQQYNPSIPAHVGERSGATDGIHNIPKEYRADMRAWDGRSQPPPRLSSLHQLNMYDAPLRSNDYRPPHYNAHAYKTHRQRLPLIDLIRNEWKHNPHAAASPTSPDYSSPNILQVLAAPKFRRHLYIILTLLVLTWGSWHYWAGPKYTEHRLLAASLNHRMQTGEGWYGANMRPDFLDMVHVQTLDQSLIPQKHDRNRLIVIGDVHGCHEECEYWKPPFSFEVAQLFS